MTLNARNVLTVALIALGTLWVVYNVEAVGKIVGVR